MPPLIFVADKKAAEFFSLHRAHHWDRDALANAGVLALVRADNAGRSTAIDINGHGPGKQSGVVFASWSDDGDCPRLGYDGDAQTWTQAAQDVWIGWEKDSPPQPADLARTPRVVSESAAVPLGDATWSVPVLREPIGQYGAGPSGTHATHLPHSLSNGLDGQLALRVRPQYADIWTRSAYWFDLLMDAESEEVSLDWQLVHDYCCDILSLNYRFCPLMQAALDVFDSTNWQDIVRASIGWHAVQDYVKKKQL